MENYEVKIHSGDEWYVYIYHNQKIIKKFYKGLKNAPDDDERMLRAKALKMVIENDLKAGWIPKKNKTALPSPYQFNLTVIEAYTKGKELFEHSDRSPGTIKDYNSHYKYFIEAVKRLKWESHNFADLEQYHLVLIIEDMIGAKPDVIPNAYFNKHLGIVKSYYQILKNNFVIKTNNALGIPERKHKPRKKELLTDEQQSLIINHFRNDCPNFITYLKVLYHLGIRPKELRLITCGMIDTERWFFKLPEEITKNDKEGIVIIPDDIRADLQRMDLSNPDWYLFGNRVYRSWNRDNHYRPAPFPMSTSSSTRYWKTEVKDKLGIHSDLYWLKSKGGNDKLRNGMPFDVVSKLMRHSSHDITEIYTTESNKINQELNIDKFGKFS